MLTNQKLTIDGDKVVLRNTFDIGTAKEIAKEDTQSGRRRKNTRCLGHIPPEMWGYDPWLQEAKKAMAFGDRQEYAKMIQKFFEVHPCFAVGFSKQIWGCSM